MSNEIADLSGVTERKSSNPFETLILEAQHDPKYIQKLYEAHRTNRNAQQANKLLSSEFAGMALDPIFLKTIDPANDPNKVDQRHCLVFWARPPAAIQDLVVLIQNKLRMHSPNIWLMPLNRLHMNVFEITHSRTAEEIDTLEAQLSPKVSQIVDWTFDHRARLVRPLLGYDSSAIALTYVPAAGESLGEDQRERDRYSYHHLRRDICDLCMQTGVPITSRYTVPSAHLTVARIVSQRDYIRADGRPDPSKMQKWVTALEEINDWLRREYWPKDNEHVKNGGEWIVGQEKGLDHRRGTLWYGGGKTIILGKGIIERDL